MPFCKKCGKEILDDGFLGYCSISCMGDLTPSTGEINLKVSDKSYSSSITILDYHGMNLFEAKNRLVDDVLEAFETGIEEIQVIHGYKHGQAIKTYIWRKSGLVKEVRSLRSDITINLFPSSSRGKTIIRFR